LNPRQARQKARALGLPNISAPLSGAIGCALRRIATFSMSAFDVSDATFEHHQQQIFKKTRVALLLFYFLTFDELKVCRTTHKYVTA
jgi:hypothetical protein